MELKEMIKVMEHFDNGGEVESSRKHMQRWICANLPYWDWDTYEYRIKEQKQEVTIEKWLIEENDIKFVVETSDIDSWLKSFPAAQKLKLLETYEVEL